MRRRTFMAAAAAQLAVPAVSRAAERTLKFVPQSDLAVLDPIWTTAYVTRNHGFMVWDTLYGQTGPANAFKATPQMVAGHVVADDGKSWTLTLRDGLLFHTGEKVLARDCVASIQRWAVRDAFGQALMARTDALTAPDDKTIVFKLKRPFALLPEALGHSYSNMCAMMPERVAKTDPFQQISEVVGSGPFRFIAKERVPGSFVSYQRFEQYKPCPTGKPDWTAGPKLVHFDRVEWHVIPDPATKANALQSGEVDWWEDPTSDLLPMFPKGGDVNVAIKDPTGECMVMRPNFLYPPFDNPAVRRALLGAIHQSEFMTAMMGTDKALWKVPCGYFPPGTPLASDASISALPSGPPDYAKVKAALNAAGYKGEKIVFMASTDQATLNALDEVANDVLKRAGLDLEYQATDWGSVVQRRSLRKAPADGGWNMFITGFAGLDLSNSAGDLPLCGNGKSAWFGWPTNPKMEDLRNAWFEASDLAAQKKIGADIQTEAFNSVPYFPLGFAYQPTAFRKDINDMMDGFAIFWNVRRS
ncbi:ABC transporter substrate-binding protein [Rhodopila sp.]|uniref:ABC transporter substrate-binding protein n=1 Tax=Rhodopila sp. TaxID=2480087 RepID=UPI003D13C001